MNLDHAEVRELYHFFLEKGLAHWRVQLPSVAVLYPSKPQH